MASSRWKRFAFFDRNTLNLPSEVLEDLIPVHQTNGRSRRSFNDSFLNSPTEEPSDESVSLVVTTAALPLTSRPQVMESNSILATGSANTAATRANQGSGTEGELNAVLEMWSCLTACAALEIPPSDSKDETSTFLLPSQVQPLETAGANVGNTGAAAVDGLVLVFVTSKDTDYIHCFDLTVRCNPPSRNDSKATSNLEDLDGWRGYIAPFKGRNATPKPSSVAQRQLSAEERIVSDHMHQDTVEGIVGIATCRAKIGHRAVHMACITASNLVVCVDPHLHLSSRRPLSKPQKSDATRYVLPTTWNAQKDGNARVVHLVPGIVAVGTDKGSVHIFTYREPKRLLKHYLSIPAPPTPGVTCVACKLAVSNDKAFVFAVYKKETDQSSAAGTTAAGPSATSSSSSSSGVCCFEMPLPKGMNPGTLSAPSARHDLDGRQVPSSNLCDLLQIDASEDPRFAIARPDGLYTYSQTQKVDVSPIDGTKLAMCIVPPPSPAGKRRDVPPGHSVGSSYALIASTDFKSRRDAVDVYDSTNKLVAFHLLLSPGHRTVRSAGVTTPPTRVGDGSLRCGRSSALVLTSGGSLVTLTEKDTVDKVHLLVQKNLYSAAILVAYADPLFEAAEITSLYRRHAEYLYRKGDYAGAIEQYIHTIGSLEPSHVIFRYLDAPKIPYLVKYLEQLRSKEHSTAVHNELLRTCYLKLNDHESAETIAVSSSRSMDNESLTSILASSPKDALATICTFEAPQAAEALIVYGATLARVLLRETAGLVVSLCLGTYSPKKISDSVGEIIADTKKMLEFTSTKQHHQQGSGCEPYPLHLFASAFMEHSRMLRIILSHCNRNKCPLTPSLRRTWLELTLAEWNTAKRNGDTEAERLRRKEAITALTDSHCTEIGDFDALVIVQLAGFDEGELLLYERLQMGPMLISRYAKDGSPKARRQMLAMGQNDPEILADVLGHFVEMVSERLSARNQLQLSKANRHGRNNKNGGNGNNHDFNDDGNDPYDNDDDEEMEDILEDIQEALLIARRQGVLPPVRIARILAGDGTGQFGNPESYKIISDRPTVPLSVAIEYVGDVLDESRKDIARLKSEVEEYNQMCNAMEMEVESLLKAASPQRRPSALDTSADAGEGQLAQRTINVEEMYAKVRSATEEGEKGTMMTAAAMMDGGAGKTELSREAFWRELEQSEDNFDTISRFFAKGIIQ